MDQIRLGIIGAGPIVEKKHLPALAEVREIAVVAACRRNAEQLNDLANRFRIADRYTDYRALLDDGRIDAVLIATGPPAQVQIAIEAAAAGKHILIEKPLAETAAGAREICRAAQAAHVWLQVGFNKRFYPGYRLAKQLIQKGELGTVSGIHARFWFQSGRRDPLLHNGIHVFDLVQFLLGPAVNVFARRSGQPATPGPVGETIAVSLEFAGRAVGNLLISSLASWDYPNEHVDIVGSNQTALSIDNGRLRVCRRGEGRPVEMHENTISVHWWSGHDEQGFAPQLRVFAQRIRDGVNPPAAGSAADDMTPGPGAGVASLLLLEAVTASLAEGRPVPVPPVSG
jgi:predicted dehydrogenase